MRKQALIDSYLDQILTTPGGGAPPPPPGFVFGTATPRGTTEWDKLHDRQTLIIDRLTQLGFDAQPGYATGFLRSFVEPVVFASGLEMEDAVDFARRMRFSTFLQRLRSAVYVVDRHGEWIGEGPERRLEQAGVCVMPNTEPGEICFMNGGPYGSRAISASLDWKWERQRLIAALGCQTCEQGKYFRMRALGAEAKVFSGGGPIALVPHEAPTRFTAVMEVSRG